MRPVVPTTFRNGTLFGPFLEDGPVLIPLFPGRFISLQLFILEREKINLRNKYGTVYGLHRVNLKPKSQITDDCSRGISIQNSNKSYGIHKSKRRNFGCIAVLYIMEMLTNCKLSHTIIAFAGDNYCIIPNCSWFFVCQKPTKNCETQSAEHRNTTTTRWIGIPKIVCPVYFPYKNGHSNLGSIFVCCARVR